MAPSHEHENPPGEKDKPGRNVKKRREGAECRIETNRREGDETKRNRREARIEPPKDGSILPRWRSSMGSRMNKNEVAEPTTNGCKFYMAFLGQCQDH